MTDRRRTNAVGQARVATNLFAHSNEINLFEATLNSVQATLINNKNPPSTGMFGSPFGQQSSYNYFPDNGDYNNSFGSHMNAGHHQKQQQQQQKRGQQYDDYYRGSEKHGYDGVRGLEHGMQEMGLDHDGGNSNNYRDTYNTTKAQTSTAAKDTSSSVPKKMTWASIASQPAKPQIRANSSSSTLKKKGPGMPPPPMVPGKHNMDVAWSQVRYLSPSLSQFATSSSF